MNKKIKISYLAVLLIICVHLSASAQTKKFNIEDLKGKIWSLMGLYNNTSKAAYLEDKIIQSFNDKYLAIMEYYLSDSICKVFNSSKVGKVLNGTFIISRPFRDEKHPDIPLTVTCLEIIELYPTKLVLRNIKQQILEYEVDTLNVTKTKRKK